jgi:cephalosporin hydroxylase
VEPQSPQGGESGQTPRRRKVLVMHDGAHDYASVLQDLNLYDQFTPEGSYMIVQDTKMTRMYEPVNGNG